MSKSIISIIDYGFGNLHSLAKALASLGAAPAIIQTPEDIARADAVFLPGVGAFGEGMAELVRRGFAGPIQEHAYSGKPLFGICLGMQFLFEYSEEFGTHKGLGLLRGGVKKIIPQEKQCKIPHVGWNELRSAPGTSGWDGTILDGLREREQVYFTHSYAASPSDAEDVIANAEYCGTSF
ncbi:MAG: imidazole glycerol phosphate synthase subunit HisH, partial [Patescibacteria group bacterium]|nr:imidazole glycerol phosphate synthase subunit HisH [Patescibacteria group bacterium]